MTSTPLLAETDKAHSRTSTELKTGCTFKAFASRHKAMGNQWLLRVVDGHHNHSPSESLLQDPEYRDWFQARRGGAEELDNLLGIVRMSVDKDPNRPAPPPSGSPLPLSARARSALEKSSKRPAEFQDAEEEDGEVSTGTPSH